MVGFTNWGGGEGEEGRGEEGAVSTAGPKVTPPSL